jgi:hypothetical protein
MLELYPPLIEQLFSKEANIAKITILSDQFDHDIQAQIRMQEVIELVLPKESLEEVIHEFNPMFFPNQEEDEEESEDEEFFDEDFSLDELGIDIESFELDTTKQIFMHDVLQSSHYFIDEPFEHLMMYGKVFATADTASYTNFETNTKVH